MGLPNQNIPENKKDPEWMRLNAQSVLRMAGFSRQSKIKDKFCYDMYNGIQDESDYDYLRKVGDYEYPAKIRFIPLLRPKADRLISEEAKRPFSFRVYTTDKESLKSKEDLKLNAIISQITSNKNQAYMQYIAASEEMAKKKAQLEQQIAQMQEAGEQITPEMQYEIDSMNQGLDMAQYIITNESVLKKEELEEIETKFKYKYKDYLEVVAEKGMKYYIDKYNLKEIFNHGFIDRVVVDKEYYMVDYSPELADPIFKKVNNLNFYYAGDDEILHVEDAEWQMLEEYMTLPQIIDKFKNLHPVEVERLKKRKYFLSNNAYSHGYYGYNYSLTGQSHINGSGGYDNTVDGCSSDSGLYSGTEDYANKIRVCRVWWQSPREINFKKSPNKHQEGSYFTKWMTDKDIIKKDKGEKLEQRYVNDIYEAVILDEDIFVNLRKKPIQDRDIDNLGPVQLPIIGPAYNHVERKPYSLIWAAKDIQILYNLVHYHKELMIAIAGVKGFIMDKSQIPEGMSMKEWMYQKKLGTGWVQTIKSGLGRQPTFNQFQTYDDTLSNSIQNVLGVLAHLEELAANVMGVSRGRMGDVAPTDQVGTNEASIQNSNLVTEIQYVRHDQVKRRALKKLCNMFRHAWKKGKRGQYVLGDMGQEILNIPSNTINKAQYDVFIADSGKIDRAIQEIKGVAAQEYQKQLMTLPQLIEIYNTDNLRELEAKLEKFGEIADKKMDAQMQNQAQNEQQAAQVEQEYKMAMENQKREIDKMKTQIEQARLDFDMGKFQQEQEFENKKFEVESQLKQAEIASERNVELQYLDQQRKESAMEFKLNQIELSLKGIEATIGDVSSSKSGGKEKIKD